MKALRWIAVGMAFAVAVGVWAQQQYNYFQPGGALSCSGACTAQSVNLSSGSFVTGNLPLANLSSIAGGATLTNATTSAATPTAINPLQLANLQSAVISASVIATSNITLSGSQAVDGVGVGAGQSVLVIGQSTASQDGIYISATGAWSRAINFPNGFIIAQFCDLSVFVEQGLLHQGQTYQLQTTSGTIHIGTDSQIWNQRILAAATTTTTGPVKVTNNTGPVSTVTASPAAVGGAQFDCAGFNDLPGSLGDVGNAAGTLGSCAITDPNGHPIFNGTGTAPSVTGTGCSLAAGTNTDTSGAIAATGIDTCTLIFAGAFSFAAPKCSIGNIGATVLANLTALPTTAHAIFATTAAGTFTYTCI